MGDHHFQVDLRGIIDLLSHHLYEDPSVFARELLQNAVDACTARGLETPAVNFALYEGADGSRSLEVRDEGIGLTEAEVHRFLATIGASTKRDVPRQDFLGRFGIGLLSAFTIADEIVLVSQSAKDPTSPAVEWRGKADGSYQLRTLPSTSIAAGTSVHLIAREDARQHVSHRALCEALRRHGRFLRAAITVEAAGMTTRIETQAPWRDNAFTGDTRRLALVRFAEAELGHAALDGVELWDPEGQFEGVAIALATAASLQQGGAHRAYLSGMLVHERIDDLFPSWAFFLASLVDFRGLSPTASRQSFVRNAALEGVRDRLDAQLRGWLQRLAREEPARFQTLLNVHGLAIRALAAEDEAFFELVQDQLTVQTSLGPSTLGELRRAGETLQVLRTDEEFRQVAGIAAARGERVINAGYSYDHELLAALERFGVPVTPIRPKDVILRLDAPSEAELSIWRAFEMQAVLDLSSYGCAVELRRFEQKTLPALYVCSEQARMRLRLDERERTAGGVFGDVLRDLKPRFQEDRPRLCFNTDNALIRRLRSLVSIDRDLAGLTFKLLYVQALMLGQHPLGRAEQALLTQGLLGLIARSLPEENSNHGS